jgi:3-hydroxybutyrate dehydrogenase
MWKPSNGYLKMRRYLTSRHPTERFVALENVGALAAFLCSPAARDSTGATIPIDGGWQAR